MTEKFVCKHTPTVLQMEASECGAACLAMVMAYHKYWVPLESLRVVCGVSRDGSKASNILRAARNYGFSAKGFKKSPNKLSELPLPSIIHWNFNHFVVLEGFSKDRAWINDPASGPRSVTMIELDESFTGVVLAFEPGPEFKPGGQKPNLFKLMLQQLRYSWNAFYFVAMVSVLLIIPGLVVPTLSKIFVDDILIAGYRQWFYPLCLGLLFSSVLRAAILILQQRYLLRLEGKLSIVMASRYFQRLLSMPAEFFIQRHAGDLGSRVISSEQIASLLAGGLTTNVLNLISVVFFAAVMLSYDVILGTISIVLAIVNAVVVRSVATQRDNLNRRNLIQSGKMIGATWGSIRAIESLKAAGGEDDAFARWAGYQANTLNSQQELGVYSGVVSIIPGLLSGLTMVAILGIGGLRVIDGVLTIGGLVAFQTLFASFSGPIRNLVDLSADLQRIKGDLARLADVFQYQAKKQLLDTGMTAIGDSATNWPPRLKGRLRLEDITFAYCPLDSPLISKFSLELQPGQRVALVGDSGSGKSTLGRLIAGSYTPLDGQVLLDEHDIKLIPAAVYANSVAYVDQDIFLFEGTVKDNLTLWDDSVPEHVITAALKDAEIHQDIIKRPGQYQALVKEGGVNFSGGQRQRLEIARTLVSDPSLLILDEATSALDPVTEKKIDDNIRRRGCAVVIIAHRLSTIRDCDEIIVLKKGQIVERGSHDELLAKGDEYASLIAMDG